MKIFILLALLMVNSAFAYSPAAHRLIVLASAEEYNFCLDVIKSEKPRMLKSEVNKIALFNKLEDINPFNRLKHWHFFSPNKDLGPVASLKGRYVDVEGKLPKRNLYKVLGPLTHYVQDVTNPAHVAPVYHGLGDGLDFYDYKNHWPNFITKDECLAIAARAAAHKGPDSFALIQRLAEETLAKMQEKVMVLSSTHQGFYSWEEAFWSTKFGPTSKQAGFGEYGFLGNDFGKSGSAVDEATTVKFAQDRIRAALNGTLELYLMKL
jgi:hypothetical protein